MRVIRTEELSAPVLECIGALGIAGVVFYGGQQVIAGATTPGTFFLLTAIIMLYEPMRKLGRVNSVLQRSLAAAERVFTVLDTPAEQPEEAEKPALSPITGNLTFACLHALSPHTSLVLLTSSHRQSG